LRASVFIHKPGLERLVQGSPVHADAHGLSILPCHIDHLFEILVVSPPGTDIARIDAVFSQQAGAFRMLGEQDMPIVVKVPDNRYRKSQGFDPLDDLGHSPGLWY
jgi:hypothetical protein